MMNSKRVKSRSIRKGDQVQVICGKDKGQVGEVLRVDYSVDRILVKGVNMVTKHVKASSNGGVGKLLRIEAPVHYSNVLLYSPHCNRGVRVRIQFTASGVKQRVCTKTSNVID